MITRSIQLDFNDHVRQFLLDLQQRTYRKLHLRQPFRITASIVNSGSAASRKRVST
ncbi:hypothetical protein M6D81_18650 [Paenibacillus sp. J5C_2022]|nr:hypothetical protein [Paenibacillus sp. J5C2022]